MKLKYFSFGKFKNPLPPKNESLIENRKNNLPPDLSNEFSVAKHFEKVWTHANDYHFYKKGYQNLQKQELYLYCIPDFKKEIELVAMDSVSSNLWNPSWDNSIYFYPSVLGKKDYNYWINIPENEQDPIFVFIYGKENMFRYAERVHYERSRF